MKRTVVNSVETTLGATSVSPEEFRRLRDIKQKIDPAGAYIGESIVILGKGPSPLKSPKKADLLIMVSTNQPCPEVRHERFCFTPSRQHPFQLLLL
jgi:hypothetical protein